MFNIFAFLCVCVCVCVCLCDGRWWLGTKWSWTLWMPVSLSMPAHTSLWITQDAMRFGWATATHLHSLTRCFCGSFCCVESNYSVFFSFFPHNLCLVLAAWCENSARLFLQSSWFSTVKQQAKANTAFGGLCCLSLETLDCSVLLNNITCVWASQLSFRSAKAVKGIGSFFSLFTKSETNSFIPHSWLFKQICYMVRMSMQMMDVIK